MMDLEECGFSAFAAHLHIEPPLSYKKDTTVDDTARSAKQKSSLVGDTAGETTGVSAEGSQSEPAVESVPNAKADDKVASAVQEEDAQDKFPGMLPTDVIISNKTVDVEAINRADEVWAEMRRARLAAEAEGWVGVLAQ